MSVGRGVQLEQNEEKYGIRIMIDEMPVCCYLIDSSHKLIDCNAPALKIFGAKSKQELFEHFLSCAPEYQPDGQRSAEKSKLMLQKTFDEGSCTYKWQYRNLDGNPVPAEVKAMRLKYENQDIVACYLKDLRTRERLIYRLKKASVKSREMKKALLAAENKIYYDSLTGLYNRRFLDENLKRVLKRLARSNGILSMMMVDIDHFKPYNDTYGHIAGDSCLKKIAETLRDTVARHSDFVTRYGGEEFVVVLPDTNEEGARKVAERMLENVRALKLPHELNSAAKYVTVSIGAMTCKVQCIHSADTYVHFADEIMYKSKRGGRNRYTFACME